MRRPVARRHPLAAAAFLLVCGASALAADDDFEFAEALYRRGYTDLAQAKYKELIDDSKSSAARRAEGQYGLALLTHGDARFLAAERNDKRRKPMEEVLKRFDEADQAFAKFITENAGHARNLEAKLSRGKLLQDKAEYVNAAIENQWLPAGTGPAQWQKQVAEWFDTAIQLFQAAEDKAKQDREKLKADRKDGGAEWDDVQDRYSIVWLFRIAALYGKGAALPKGDAAAIAALTQCVREGADAYQWEFGETVRGLWAMHYAGLASALLDKPGDAWGQLTSIAGPLKEDGGSSPAVTDVVFQSFRELGKFALAAGRRDKDDWPKKAHDYFEKHLPTWPDWKKVPEGQRAAIVWAKLRVQQGANDRAISLLQEVSKIADSMESPARFEVTRALGELLTGGGSTAGGGMAELDPATARKIAMGKWREQDYRGAIAAFQAVIANCNDDAERDKYAWEAWDFIGRSYHIVGRYYESYLAFDQIEQAWRKERNNPVLSELTNETAYSRAAALDSLVRETKDPADKEAAKRAVDEFTKDHPAAPRNQDAEQQSAEVRLKDAEGLRDDPAAYKAALGEALKVFEGLKKNVELNQAVAAQIRHRMAMADPDAADVAGLDQAIQAADAWLGEKRPDATESRARQNRERGRRIALLVALSARADRAAALARKRTDAEASLKAHQDLLAALDRHGPEFKDIAASGQTQLDNWRAEGLIGVDKVDDADQLVGRILEALPGSRNNLYLAALIGSALERRALVQKDKGDMIGFKQLMIRSARRREWVLENTKLKDGSPAPRNPDAVRTIAATYAKGGEFQKAEVLYTEAQKAFEAAADATADAKAKEDHLKRARTCRIELIGLLVLQEKYDAAIPQLEKELAKDPKRRDAFLKAIQATDNIPESKFRELLAGTDANRALLDSLSEAYMKAPSKERLMAAVNLCTILNLTIEKEQRHGPEFIEHAMRRAEAYLLLGEFTKLPEYYRAAVAAVRNGMAIPGYLESYEQTVPGAKRRGETIMQRGEDGLRKLGTK